jgi:hypothetical protein
VPARHDDARESHHGAARTQAHRSGGAGFELQLELGGEHDVRAHGGFGERQIVSGGRGHSRRELGECAPEAGCEQRDARTGHLLAGSRPEDPHRRRHRLEA